MYQPLPPPAEGDASLPYDISNLRNYSLAVSGDVFRWMVDYAPADVLNRVCTFSAFGTRLLMVEDACLWPSLCSHVS